MTNLKKTIKINKTYYNFFNYFFICILFIRIPTQQVVDGHPLFNARARFCHAHFLDTIIIHLNFRVRPFKQPVGIHLPRRSFHFNRLAIFQMVGSSIRFVFHKIFYGLLSFFSASIVAA